MKPETRNARRCAAITKSGTQCSRYALDGSEYCAIHNRKEGAAPLKKAYPSVPENGLLGRIQELCESQELFALGIEIATLKALLEHGLDRLETERAEGGSYSDPSLKRVQSIVMDILSASEKFARVEERRRGVLTGDEIGAIIDRIKERVIEVVNSRQENDSPEETAGRIAKAFDSIEIVGCGG